VLPPGLLAHVHRSTWSPAPIFRLVGELGGVPSADLERTLNMGVGMLAVLPPSAAVDIIGRLATHGVPAWVAGEVLDDDGSTDGVTRGAKGVDGGAAALIGQFG
jgi:phosphoribosylformylglycinamidine cyclo-ligase